MNLPESMKDRATLDDLLTKFDTFLSKQAELAGIKMVELPVWMRLTPYLIAFGEPDYEHFQISNKIDFWIESYKKKNNQRTLGYNHNLVTFCIGDVTFEHSVQEAADKHFYREILTMFTEEGRELAVSLYSANAAFLAGHDFNEVNRIGDILYLGTEGAFKRLLRHPERLNQGVFDTERYKIHPSQYELVITPKLQVTESNIEKSFSDVIHMANNTLMYL